jgi:hypothetical protein
MGRQSKWEYFRAVFARYGGADRETKRKMLDEFCANMGRHRKHALQLLNGPPPSGRRPRPADPVRRTAYGRALLLVLKAVRKAARHARSVRLKALLPREVASLSAKRLLL